jgi:pilus assembly protein CpaB
MNRRIGLLAASLAVALLGTAAVFSYVNGVEADAANGAEMVEVLVAAERVPAGTSATTATKSGLVQLSSLPRRSVPEGALKSLDDLGDQTAVSDIFAGEVLLKAKFADQTARTGALVIPKDKIAVSVELGDPQRVAGFVVPGSEVAIFATVDAAGAVLGADGEYTDVLLPRVSVIAVGPATLRPDATPAPKKKGDDTVTKAVLTVAVSQDEAARLVHGAQTGELYLGLLSTTSKTGGDAGVSTSNLFK